MKKNIFLVSETTVRAYTNMDDNIQSKLLKPAILESCMELETILGQNLMEKIQDLISGGTIDNPENAVYKQILDESQYLLSYATMVKVIVPATVKIANFGATTAEDEKMQNIGLKEAYGLEDYYQHKVDSFIHRLQLLLLRERVRIPELNRNQIHKINTNLYSANSSGLFLGGARGRGVINPRFRVGYDYPRKR